MQFPRDRFQPYQPKRHRFARFAMRLFDLADVDDCCESGDWIRTSDLLNPHSASAIRKRLVFPRKFAIGVFQDLRILRVLLPLGKVSTALTAQAPDRLPERYCQSLEGQRRRHRCAGGHVLSGALG